MNITTTKILAFGVLTSLIHGTSLAATTPASNRLPGAPSDTPVAPATIAAPKPQTRSTGLGAALQELADQGIFLRANLINQYARNTRGAVEQGHTNVGQFNIGADFNLDKLVGTSGSSFHFTVYKDYGFGLNHDVTGTFPKQQHI